MRYFIVIRPGTKVLPFLAAAFSAWMAAAPCVCAAPHSDSMDAGAMNHVLPLQTRQMEKTEERSAYGRNPSGKIIDYGILRAEAGSLEEYLASQGKR